MVSNINYFFDENDKKWIMQLKGDIDIYSSPQFKEAINAAFKEKNADFSLDCSELNYMDSTGLGVLIGALKKMKEHEKNIYIKNLKPNVKKLFNITGLDKIFILEG